MKTPALFRHNTNVGIVEIREIVSAGSRLYELWFEDGDGDRFLERLATFFELLDRLMAGNYDAAAGWPISTLVPAELGDWHVCPSEIRNPPAG